MRKLKVSITIEHHKKVKNGIEFLLSHFVGRHTLFPRKMSTLANNGRQLKFSLV